MSNPNDHSSTRDPRGGPLVSFLAILGCLVLFGLVIGLAYLPNRPAPVDAQLIEQRLTRLAETRAAGQAALSEFRVIDRDAGVVALPIERAIELVIAETAGSSSEQ